VVFSRGHEDEFAAGYGVFEGVVGVVVEAEVFREGGEGVGFEAGPGAAGKIAGAEI